MRIIEFGNKSKPIMVLIHGFESMYQIWDEYISTYMNDYHIIVPILPSHDSEQKEEFESFDKITIELEQYISKYSNTVDIIYAMSMGGVIAFKLFERQKLSIKKLILDGSPLQGIKPLLKHIMLKNYLNLTKKAKARHPKTILKAVNTIVPENKLGFFLEMIDAISYESINEYINHLAKYKLSVIESDTKIYYFHGTKLNESLSKATSRYISKNYINARIIKLKGFGHCEKAILHPLDMIEEINQIIK